MWTRVPKNNMHLKGNAQRLRHVRFSQSDVKRLTRILFNFMCAVIQYFKAVFDSISRGAAILATIGVTINVLDLITTRPEESGVIIDDRTFKLLSLVGNHWPVMGIQSKLFAFCYWRTYSKRFVEIEILWNSYYVQVNLTKRWSPGGGGGGYTVTIHYTPVLTGILL